MRSPGLIFLHIHSPRSFDSALMGYTQNAQSVEGVPKYRILRFGNFKRALRQEFQPVVLAGTDAFTYPLKARQVNYKSVQVSVAPKCLHFGMTERSLRTPLGVNILIFSENGKRLVYGIAMNHLIFAINRPGVLKNIL